MHDALHVQHAHDAVDVALVHRQARVLALAQLIDDLVPVILHIDADDFGARHHDVLHRGLLQIENADQHLLMAMGNHGARLGDHGAQFLAAQGVRRLLLRYAQQTQYAVRKQIGGQHERIQQPQQRRVYIRRRQRETLRMQRAEGLGGDLAEDQDDEGQCDDPDGHEVIAAQAKGDEADQRRRHDIDDGAQQQNEPDQSVGVGEQGLRQPRAAMSGLGPVAQPVSVQAHERGLAAGKEGRQNQQRGESAEQ